MAQRLVVEVYRASIATLVKFDFLCLAKEARTSIRSIFDAFLLLFFLVVLLPAGYLFFTAPPKAILSIQILSLAVFCIAFLSLRVYSARLEKLIRHSILAKAASQLSCQITGFITFNGIILVGAFTATRIAGYAITIGNTATVSYLASWILGCGLAIATSNANTWWRRFRKMKQSTFAKTTDPANNIASASHFDSFFWAIVVRAKFNFALTPQLFLGVALQIGVLVSILALAVSRYFSEATAELVFGITIFLPLLLTTRLLPAVSNFARRTGVPLLHDWFGHIVCSGLFLIGALIPAVLTARNGSSHLLTLSLIGTLTIVAISYGVVHFRKRTRRQALNFMTRELIVTLAIGLAFPAAIPLIIISLTILHALQDHQLKWLAK